MNKGDIKIDGIGTDDQLADIFTKPLNESRFCKLRNELNIIDFLKCGLKTNTCGTWFLFASLVAFFYIFEEFFSLL